MENIIENNSLKDLLCSLLIMLILMAICLIPNF